ncbi:MAG: PLP-dependent aminotransferase family protein, partial [Bacillota bacterium]
FETNEIDTSLFPNATWAKLSRQVLSENYEQMLNETDPQGLFLLRKEIARYLEIYRGMTVNINQIIIGSGSTSLISLIVEILGRKNHYAIENPGYKKIYQLFKANDVNLSLISLDEHGVSMQALKSSKASVIHITPSHQFPMGIVMPIQRRVELLNWANESPDRFIIEDDYDSEFRYQGMPIPALQGLDQHDSIIYMNTFTKTLAPSFRISYMVLPKRLMYRYEEISLYHGCTVPNFEQYILYKFMSEGHFERHINRMRNLYKQKIEVIIKKIQKYPYLRLNGYDAGLHALLVIEKDVNVEKLLLVFEHEKIKISSISDYYHSEHLQTFQTFILGYAGIPLEQLSYNIDKLLNTIDSTIKEL